jgi:hypothetical protein
MMFSRNAIQTLCRSSVFQVGSFIAPSMDPFIVEKLTIIHSQAQRRSVTTLKETLLAQVPEKQAEMARLKKEHGSHV